MHAKSNSAPPSRLKLPGHGTVEEQMAAIGEMKQRAAETTDKLDMLRSRVKKQKCDSTTLRVKQQWLQERSALFAERKACEQALQEQLASVDQTVRSSLSKFEPFQAAVESVQIECRNWAVDTADASSAIMINILSLRARVHAHANRDSRTKEEIAIQQAIEQFKKYIDDETRTWQLDAVDMIDGTTKMLQQMVDGNSQSTLSEAGCTATSEYAAETVDDLEADAESRLAMNREQFPQCDDQLSGLFRAAIADAVKGCVLPIEPVEPLGLTVTSDDLTKIAALTREYDPSRHKHLLGKTSELLHERICFELPHLSQEVARRAVRSLTQQSARKRQQRQLIAAARKVVDHLLGCHKQALIAEANVIAAENQRVLAEKAEQERKATAAARIGELRTQYNDKISEQNAAKLEAEEHAQRIEESKRAKLQEEYDERLRKLSEHLAAKQELEQRDAQLAEELKRQELAELLARQQHNQARVEARMAECQRKTDELRLSKLMLDEERQKKEETLQAFYNSIVEKIGVDRDPSRLLQPTVASAQEGGYVPAREAALPRAVHGFTVERLMQDPRFKLHQALVAAGLHKTAYARSVVNAKHHVAPAHVVSVDNPLRMGS